MAMNRNWLSVTIAWVIVVSFLMGMIGAWVFFLWQRESLVERTRQAVLAELPPQLVGLKGRTLIIADGYSYLPGDSELYIPTWADWQRVKANAAQNSEQYLTDRLKRTNFVLTQGENEQIAIVDTEPQPEWFDAWKGKGRFNCSDRELRATYQEAAEATMIIVKNYLSDATTNNTMVALTIHGYAVGTYRDGKLSLEGEAAEE